jgi:hypothetical protein
MDAGESISAEVGGHITPDVQSLAWRLGLFAAHTAHELKESWKRTTRPNQRIELEALRRSLQLSRECSEAAYMPQLLLAPKTVEQRYKLRAGVLVVDAVLPFGQVERNRLLSKFGFYDSSRTDWWLANIPDEEHTMVDRWHRWLRMNGNQPAERGADNYGDASLLYAAAIAIEEGVRAADILPWHSSASEPATLQDSV